MIIFSLTKNPPKLSVNSHHAGSPRSLWLLPLPATESPQPPDLFGILVSGHNRAVSGAVRLPGLPVVASDHVDEHEEQTAAAVVLFGLLH